MDTMFFDDVSQGKPDPIFGLAGVYRADLRPQKVDLMVGIYKDEHLHSPLLPSVNEARKRVFSQNWPADYLPFDGVSSFCDGLGGILFGEKRWEELSLRTYACQALGGTGALRLAGEFLFQEISQAIYIPDPSWSNHRQIFENVGLQIHTYPYYDRERKSFDFEAMCQSLERAPPRTAILLHATCHNPSGKDPSIDQWREIFSILQKKELIPFFDCAYQGFGLGLEKDAQAICLCLEYCSEMIVAYSCSKNFSLYNERVGALFVVANTNGVKEKIASQVRRLIRVLYSNPPSNGSRIVDEVIKDPILFKQWKLEVDQMRHRIEKTRREFIEKLIERSKTVDFSYLHGSLGLFMFLNLTKPQVSSLMDQFGIYLLENGRVSIAGMNQKNLDYVVNSIIEVSSR